jgi:hypothetical protein
MSTLISFRLTDDEANLLARLQENDESLSLVAARIVREKLGVSEVNTRLTSSLTSLEDLITDIVNSKLTSVNNNIKESIDEFTGSEIKTVKAEIEQIKTRLWVLETPKKRTSTAAKKTTKTPDAAGTKGQGEIVL